MDYNLEKSSGDAYCGVGAQITFFNPKFKNVKKETGECVANVTMENLISWSKL